MTHIIVLSLVLDDNIIQLQTIININGKICYDIEVKPTVKLIYCLLELSKWVEIEEGENICG